MVKLSCIGTKLSEPGELMVTAPVPEAPNDVNVFAGIVQ